MVINVDTAGDSDASGESKALFCSFVSHLRKEGTNDRRENKDSLYCTVL